MEKKVNDQKSFRNFKDAVAFEELAICYVYLGFTDLFDLYFNISSLKFVQITPNSSWTNIEFHSSRLIFGNYQNIAAFDVFSGQCLLAVNSRKLLFQYNVSPWFWCSFILQKGCTSSRFWNCALYWNIIANITSTISLEENLGNREPYGSL